MFQTIAVTAILAGVLIYLVRRIYRHFTSPPQKCSSCHGCPISNCQKRKNG